MIREQLKVNVDYYVYMLYYPDNKTPMYVGKGSKNRWNECLANARLFKKAEVTSNPRFYNTLARLFVKGIEVPKRKVLENLTEQEAYEHEKRLIAQYGILGKGGLLLNKSPGGRGFATGFPGSHSDETRERMRRSHTGTKKSEETKAKIRQALLGRKKDLTDEQKSVLHLRFGKKRRE